MFLVHLGELPPRQPLSLADAVAGNHFGTSGMFVSSSLSNAPRASFAERRAASRS